MPAKIPNNVDPAGTYMLSGVFINAILDCLRERTISFGQENGPVQVSEKGKLGTVLGVQTTTC